MKPYPESNPNPNPNWKVLLAGMKVVSKKNSTPYQHGFNISGSSGETPFEWAFAAENDAEKKEICSVLRKAAVHFTLAAVSAAMEIKRSHSILQQNSGHHSSVAAHGSERIPEKLIPLYKLQVEKWEKWEKLNKHGTPNTTPVVSSLPALEKDDEEIKVKMQRNLAWHRHTLRFTPRCMLKLDLSGFFPYHPIIMSSYHLLSSEPVGLWIKP